MNINLSIPTTNTQLSFGSAIYTINLHTKTAINPEILYKLKKAAILKLLEEGKAKKLGLQYRLNPKKSYQKSDVLIQVENYLFHYLLQGETLTYYILGLKI